MVKLSTINGLLKNSKAKKQKTLRWPWKVEREVLSHLIDSQNVSSNMYMNERSV